MDEDEETMTEQEREDLAERLYEQMMSDFHGGSEPFTMKEKQDEARKLKWE